LRHVPWLSNCDIWYWGDLDTEGFEILSSLRALHPAARSFLMDENAVERWQHLALSGTGRTADVPIHLTESEQAAFVRCRDHDLRIEQERLPHTDVVAAIQNLVQDVMRSRQGADTASELPMTFRQRIAIERQRNQDGPAVQR
jgi:hypothetical protein